MRQGLNKIQINDKIKFINDYIHSENAATAAKFDANANVSNKNIATLEAELYKDYNIQINRHLLWTKIKELFGESIANQYLDDLEDHIIYTHDETSLKPYCTSISMYPFLLDGLKSLGGESGPPQHLESFCGSFVNLVFAISSQFAGAVATVEFLPYFDYFARKDYGDDYINTHTKMIDNHLQHVTYALNQPAAARGYQCVRSDTTQLSTPEGYKYLYELKEGDLCYVWKDGQIDIEPIKKLNVYDYDGDLIQFSGYDYQQTVTPNHRVVYNTENGYKIREAHELYNAKDLYLPIGSNGIVRDDYPITDNLLKLCAKVISIGNIKGVDVENNYSGYIEFNLNDVRPGNIEELLKACGIGYSIKENILTISNIESQVILRLIKHTNKIPHFFKLLSKRQLDIVISAIGDSSSRNNELVITSWNDNILDDLQEIVFLAGYGSEIVDNYLVIFMNKKDEEIDEYKKVYYKGQVWCPTTDAGVVVFREENGIPYISGNSVFWNISVFDEYYFNSLFENFVFPDATPMNWETTKKLQEHFMSWFNKEREKAVLTFPVVTAAFINDGQEAKDKDFLNMITKELSEGNSFFMYLSDSVDSLASCCRLRNEFSDNTFSYSLGAGGVATGSINVMTLNMNRLVQRKKDLLEQIKLMQKYQIAYRKIVEDYLNSGMLPVYDAGYITLKKQFLTLGINGMVEAAEFLGYTPGNNDEYKNFVGSQLKIIFDQNKAGAEYFSKLVEFTYKDKKYSIPLFKTIMAKNTQTGETEFVDFKTIYENQDLYNFELSELV